MSPAQRSEPEPERFQVAFDGRALPATAGQSLAAVLLDAGIRSWRTTRVQHRPRGLFCGIGICYDCLLTVDGVPNQRACLVPARPGMTLSSTSPEHRPFETGEDTVD
ncbi:(2Fe-2S)-binding protein [Saccharopolyspora griseoalba]|uniref:(2Fe-2S)-binding protein n=1 Tax=Saccharopolyspora griseoalba TaxID=1431848 RepID=A0ABW2LLZ3_9PSEU